jgi:hypothetical protein
MLAPLNTIGLQPLLHELTAEYLLTGFLPQSLEFGVRGLTPVPVAPALGPCPHFLVKNYHFPVDAVQQTEMFANAEHDESEIFGDTKLVPLTQHHMHFRNKVPKILSKQ